MAHLGQRNDVYTVRFRHGGRPYQKSLKTRNEADAIAALHGVEQTLHLLRIGKLQIPAGVDAGDFVVSGGTIQRPVSVQKIPTTNAAVIDYLAAMKPVIAPSYHDSQRTHLSHFQKHLKLRADRLIDRLGREDLEGFLQARLQKVDSSTVEKERITLRRFFHWAAERRYIDHSPADGIARLPSGRDLPPFRTIEEIEAIVVRGGLGEDRHVADLWERLYLNPSEIAGLLKTVRKRATDLRSAQLHSLAAYTGMRRGEILRLRWSDVSFDENILTAYSRKQSRRQKETARRIDIHAELAKLLSRWRKQCPTGQFVVASASEQEPIDKDAANRLFWQPLRDTTWCLDSKRNWFKIGFHTYRHSFASNMAAAGVDQRVIDEYLGHTTEAMRRRYRHLFPRDRRAAIEAFSFARN